VSVLTRSQTKSIVLNQLQMLSPAAVSLADIPEIAGFPETDEPQTRTINSRVWKRRIRELQKLGWWIISCAALSAMKSEGEFIADLCPDITSGTSYVLLRNQVDREAAYRWNVAKDIRKEVANVQDRILEYMRKNMGKIVTGEELRYVAKEKTEWARRVRELRTEFGWPIVTKNSGRPDLAVGVYLLEQDRQSPVHDRKIPDPVRRNVLRRDSYRCRRCGWTHSLWNRSDPRHLELHHIEAHAAGGENTEPNLITLCTICHDVWHSVEHEWEESGFYSWLNEQ